ncbi:MAG: hypothetical protein ACRCZ1_07010, partial [Cetobacterium sp.]
IIKKLQTALQILDLMKRKRLFQFIIKNGNFFIKKLKIKTDGKFIFSIGFLFTFCESFKNKNYKK